MSAAERRANDYCGPTCPAVDRRAGDFLSDLEQVVAPQLWKDVQRDVEGLIESIKDVGTEALRSALVEACGDLIEAEAARDIYERQVDELQARLDDALSDARSLNEQLLNALAEAV